MAIKHLSNIAPVATDSFVASGASHAPGVVPDPGSTAGTTRYLREDATWAPARNLLVAATDGATVTFDLSATDRYSVTLGGNRTLALSNVTTGMSFTLVLKQDGTGSRTVTWFSGISWPGGTVPTLTTTASKSDVFTFICTASGAYIGLTAGQAI